MQNAKLFPTTLPPLPPTHTVVLLFFQICSWETSGGSFYGGNNFKTMFKTKQLLNIFKFWCKWGIRLVWWLATCTNRSHNQWSFKQWVGILLMTKIDRVCKNYLTPKIWEESHLRETFYGTLIFQQSSMICIGRHVGGHTPALQHVGVQKEVIHDFEYCILVTWAATNLLILRKWCWFLKPNRYYFVSDMTH